MIFKTVVPILYSCDIAKSLAYYTDVLGFEEKWEWGAPPTFGGTCKNSVEVFFCKDGQGHPGTWLAIMVDKVDEYYATVKSKGAKTSAPPQTQDWGVREFLVEDPDGHIIRFGQSVYTDRREKGGKVMPESIRISEKRPTGLDSPAIVYSVVAEDILTNEQVGHAYLLGNNAGFFYVKDVNVDPRWQGRRIGTALMQALSDWLEKNAPGSASVWLHTAEHLAPFYKEFGFTPVFGMARFFPPNAR